MYFRGHFQNAYVTRNLDRAMALVTKRFGIRDFIVFEPHMVLKTPDGEKNAHVRAALGWGAGHQIELIEPVSGHVGHYIEHLPADASDAGLRFHHIAVRRDDLDAMRAEIDALGFPLVQEGEVPGLVFIYLDARDVLGHFIEYIWATPEAWDMQGWPKDRPIL